MSDLSETLLMLQNQISELRTKNMVQESVLRCLFSALSSDSKSRVIENIEKAFSQQKNSPLQEEISKNALAYFESVFRKM